MESSGYDPYSGAHNDEVVDLLEAQNWVLRSTIRRRSTSDKDFEKYLMYLCYSPLVRGSWMETRIRDCLCTIFAHRSTCTLYHAVIACLSPNVRVTFHLPHTEECVEVEMMYELLKKIVKVCVDNMLSSIG